MTYDLKIVGGTIIDGTGAERYRGDVGIADGRIVALGQATDAARRTIDAGGQVVAPGFVDVHTHYDAQIFWDPMLTVSPWHGVTTVVIGNCGFGVAPTRPDHRRLILQTLERVEGMPLDALDAGMGAEWPFVSFTEYMDAIEARGSAINVAVMAGHTPIRLFAMGEEAAERRARPDELAVMKQLVRGAIDAGAIGFATSVSNVHYGFGGKPVPSRLADFDEILALSQAMAASGQGIIHYNVGRLPRFDEYEALVAATGRPLSWTSLLSYGMGPGAHRNHLARAHDQRDRGLPIHPQSGARPITLEFDFAMPMAFDTWHNFAPARTAQSADELRRHYADRGFRDAFKAEVDGRGTNHQHFPGGTGEAAGMLAGFRRMVVSSFTPNPAFNERPLDQLARELGSHPIDVMLDLALQSDLSARFRMPRANFDEGEMAEIVSDPLVVLGLGDGGAHLSQLCDACHSTYLLDHWVRETGVLTLEQAVHRLTGHTAQVFGITDRGRLALDRPADVVVFDPATVGAGPLERIHDLPAGADRLVSRPSGVAAVIVNGRQLPPPGGRAEHLTGRLLRNGRARSNGTTP
ncbi:MAG: amidohydrolase family protein [Alphaproteobacteria bacterium]|nr:amidohydrolase family protein [Alphaproteobacteria bacterium]